MFVAAVMKALQVYGIAILISLLVAVLIKGMVVLTGRVRSHAPKDAAGVDTSAPPEYGSKTAQGPSTTNQTGISGEVIAAISAAISVAFGPHRIVQITEKPTKKSGF